ncbi:hypothetical protein EST38_g3679 [Candolleomyces aberdarensis]|uniref:Nephrocystin 3-like N-terminal domain-containing protein n=1 Tax=Candolleomyces aberdarensis TaxID=2316362 RepID=A0A4V1Q4I2_9AGAR|nr:hypothetical protein EST38_g3679 [Candolleomyces aberdarensis]
MNILEGAQHGTQIGQLNAYHVEGNLRLIQQSIPPEDITLFDLLRPITDASHARDRKRAPPDAACFPGTRTEVIRAILSWAISSLLVRWQHVIWLYGYAGSGKSAIAQEVCEQIQGAMLLLASFFFFRNAGDRSRIGRLPNTLASQLARTIPETAPLIAAAVKAEPDLVLAESTLSLSARLQRLVYDPFKAVVERSLFGRWSLCRPYLIVIDGLDECEDKEGAQEFIDCTLKFFEQNPYIPLRVFISSRIEQHIQPCLNVASVRLLDLSDHCSSNDVEAFLETAFKDAIKASPVVQAYVHENGEWPSRPDFRKLVDHIGGSFIFASTLFKFIFGPNGQDDHSTPMDRLPLTLGIHPGLDGLYSETLARSEHRLHFSIIISTIARLLQPLPISELANLLGIQAHEVAVVLMDLQAIIQVPGTDNAPVTVCHRSLIDFLTTRRRSGRFFVPPSFHARLYVYGTRYIFNTRQYTNGVDLNDTSAIFFSLIIGILGHYHLAARYLTVADLEELVQLEQNSMSQRNHNRLEVLNALGRSLQDRFARYDTVFHIQKAISLHREALALSAPSDTNGSVEILISASHLGTALRALHDCVRGPSDSAIDCINTAVDLHRRCLQLPGRPESGGDQRAYPNGLPSQCKLLNNLANALCSMKCGEHRHVQASGDGGHGGGSEHDHEEIESLCHRSLELADASDTARFCPLMNLGIVSYCRFNQSRSVKDLQKAVYFLHQALAIRTTKMSFLDSKNEDHLDHAKAFRYLVACLQSFYEVGGSIEHLDEAIENVRQLLLWYYTSGHRRRGEWREKLVSLLQVRFDVMGERDILDQIASLRKEKEEENEDEDEDMASVDGLRLSV